MVSKFELRVLGYDDTTNSILISKEINFQFYVRTGVWKQCLRKYLRTETTLNMEIKDYNLSQCILYYMKIMHQNSLKYAILDCMIFTEHLRQIK